MRHSKAVKETVVQKVLDRDRHPAPGIPRCPRCDSVMIPGIALENEVEGVPDFPGDVVPVTLSYSGRARLVPCMKCPDCGKSFY